MMSSRVGHHHPQHHHHHHHHHHEQHDILVPSFDAQSRQSQPIVAIFNLIATIVGGGVLSLPYAFLKLGVGWATIFMIIAGLVTEQSLYLLCICARLTGATSYGEVGRMAFGPVMETTMSALLFVFLMFVLIGYQVLLRDIWTPLVQQGLTQLLLLFDYDDGHDDENDSNNKRLVAVSGNLVLACVMILLSPFVVQHSLHALRYNCFVGFFSVSLLCFALCHHAFFGIFPTNYETTTSTTNVATATETVASINNENDDDNNNINSPLYFTTSLGNVLFAFPIIMLSFLSHFNILPIQAALVEPTRQRTRTVVQAAVAGCGILMYLFGLGGYIYAGAATEGNILLNITTTRSDDPMFIVGRFGVGISIMMATPMMTLPCRENLLELVDVLIGKEDEVETTMIGEQTALLRDDPIQKDPLFWNPWLHYGSTFGIVAVTYLAAAVIPSVAMVWSLCGSSMAFLIAFILPAAYYLQIQRREHVPHSQGLVTFCWILLVVSVVSAIACTIQTIFVRT